MAWIISQAGQVASYAEIIKMVFGQVVPDFWNMCGTVRHDLAEAPDQILKMLQNRNQDIFGTC